MTGDFIDAPTAESWGLINRCVDEESLDDVVRDLSLKLCSKSAAALAAGKHSFYQQLEQGYAQALDNASDAMACNLLFPETRAKIREFLG